MSLYKLSITAQQIATISQLKTIFIYVTIPVGQEYEHCNQVFCLKLSLAIMQVLSWAWFSSEGWLGERFAPNLIWLLARLISLWSMGLRVSVLAGC